MDSNDCLCRPTGCGAVEMCESILLPAAFVRVERGVLTFRRRDAMTIPYHIRASEIMSSPVITVAGDTTVREAAKLMLEKNIGCVVVADAEGRLEGLMSERLFMPEQVAIPFMRGTSLQLLGQWVDSSSLEEAIAGYRARRVEEVMARDVPTASEDALLGDLADIMVRNEVHHVPILRDGIVAGIVSRHDMLRAFTGL